MADYKAELFAILDENGSNKELLVKDTEDFNAGGDFLLFLKKLMPLVKSEIAKTADVSKLKMVEIRENSEDDSFYIFVAPSKKDPKVELTFDLYITRPVRIHIRDIMNDYRDKIADL